MVRLGSAGVLRALLACGVILLSAAANAAAPPVVTDVAPGNGPLAGGTTVTIDTAKKIYPHFCRSSVRDWAICQ